MALVLVVDDSPTEQHIIARVLQDHGFETVVASDGQEAINIASSAHPDIILMDIVMPGMNGLEAFRRIRKVKPGAKVVLFTGFFRDAAEAIRQGVEEGMIDEFIRKPYFADEIIRTAAKYA